MIRSLLDTYCAFSASGSDSTSGSGSGRPPLIGGCAGTRYGCCPDRVTAAAGNNFLGCPFTSCRLLVNLRHLVFV